jgi:hypothetical protein
MQIGHNISQYERARCVVDHVRGPVSTRNTRKPEGFQVPPPPPPPFYGSVGTDRKLGAGARRPRCRCDTCETAYLETTNYVMLTFANYDDINPRETKELTEHQYLICYSHLFGFILKDRVFRKLFSELPN